MQSSRERGKNKNRDRRSRTGPPGVVFGVGEDTECAAAHAGGAQGEGLAARLLLKARFGEHGSKQLCSPAPGSVLCPALVRPRGEQSAAGSRGAGGVLGGRAGHLQGVRVLVMSNTKPRSVTAGEGEGENSCEDVEENLC